MNLFNLKVHNTPAVSVFLCPSTRVSLYYLFSRYIGMILLLKLPIGPSDSSRGRVHIDSQDPVVIVAEKRLSEVKRPFSSVTRRLLMVILYGFCTATSVT